MSSENESSDNKNVTGRENDVIQGNENIVSENNITANPVNHVHVNISLPVNGASPDMLPPSSSPQKPPIFDWKKSKLWLMKTLVTIGFVIGVAGAGMVVVPKIIDKDASKSPEISLGEEFLINFTNKEDIPIKKELESAFLAKDYQQYRNLLTEYLEKNPNSPEIWVYWNNAKAALLSKNPIKIAVSIPIGTNKDVAEEILRGVALAQNEINDEFKLNGINGRLLQVIIANDNNDAQKAKEVAETFVKDPSILAVVGHNASNASLTAKESYKDKLVMITPTSFSDKIQGDSYIFRMVPQISYFANKLATYIKEENPNSIVGTCNDPSSPDND